ncbi:MAG TPA: MFS transporter [Nevskiaceae bacterium]|nr:MFS transporter [Nevskiaceae bacterium]
MDASSMSLGRRIALGAGDLGFNLYWQMASLYLLFFYTDVVRLPPATAGAIYMGALIWDAALDPAIGAFADRTRTRWGRYRPYLLLGGVPLALVYTLVFAGSFGNGNTAVALTAAIHVLFRTVYAVVSIPYAALFARVTHDARLRASLAGYRMIFATLAAVIVAAATLPLVQALSTPEAPRRGWIVVGFASGLLSTLLLLGVAWATRGYDAVEDETPPPHHWRDMLRTLAANRALLLLLGSIMISLFSGTLFGKNLLYYFKYVVGQEKLGSAALAMTALMVGLFVPVFTWLSRRRGKREAWIIGAWPGLAGLLLWHFADGHGVPLLFGALTLSGIASAAGAVCFWSLLPDTVEYGEWKTGIRTESLVFGLAILGQKAALGLGAGLLGILLGHAGYVADVPQSPATLDAIKQMMFWIPLAGGVLSLALIWLCPLTLASHAQMVKEIAQRKGG